MNIVVFAASDLEYNTVKATLTNWKTTDDHQSLLAGQGYSGENLVELFCTKMGPKNAAQQSTKALEKSNGKIVLVIGLAGALAAECQQGDLVVYNSCYFLSERHAQPTKINCEQKLTNFLSNSLSVEDITIHKGDGLTFPKVVCQAQEKLSLANKYKAIAVDMESYQILIAAQEKQLPATVLRIISDDAQGDLPDLNAAMNQNGEVDNLKMIWQFTKHPVLATKFLINLNKSISILKACLPKVLARNFAELC